MISRRWESNPLYPDFLDEEKIPIKKPHHTGLAPCHYGSCGAYKVFISYIISTYLSL